MKKRQDSFHVTFSPVFKSSVLSIMALSDYLNPHYIQLGIVVVITVGFHFYFIRQRLAFNYPEPVTPIEDFDKDFYTNRE